MIKEGCLAMNWKAKLLLLGIFAIIMSLGGASSQTGTISDKATGEAVSNANGFAGAVYENRDNPTSLKAFKDYAKGVASDALEAGIVIVAKEGAIKAIIYKGAEAYVAARAAGDYAAADAIEATTISEASEAGTAITAGAFMAEVALVALPLYFVNPERTDYDPNDLNPHIINSKSQPTTTPSSTAEPSKKLTKDYGPWSLSKSTDSTGWSEDKRLESVPTNQQLITQPVVQQPVTKPVDQKPATQPAAVTSVQIGSSQAQLSTDQPTNAQIKTGNEVETTNALNVRSAPGTSGSTVISTKNMGSTGTILDGPVSADGFTWWKIKYDDGTTGWSEDKRLESVPANQQSATQQTSQSTGMTPKVILADKPTYYPPGATSNGNGPVQLSSLTNNQQKTTLSIDQQPITRPVDQQPVASKYTSQIPSGDVQFNPGTSSVASAPGQVQVNLDLRNENGNAVPPGTEVTAKDGSGNYVQVNWDSNGHALANGAPGTWTITANAPGYATNINNVDVSSSSSSTSSKMYLQKAGINNQAAPISSVPANQPAIQPIDQQPDTQRVVQQPTPSVANVPLELDLRNENGNPVPPGTKITVQDGSGNIVSVNCDSNGHALAYGAPGNWKITADAPGYSTNTGYTPVSSASSSTNFRMNLQRDGYNQPAPVSSPPVNQPVTQPVDQQPANQPSGPAFGDNQPAVDQQPANQPSGPAFGDNQPAVDQQPANQPSGPAFGDNQPAVDQQPANQPSGPAFGDNQPAVDQQPANQPSGPAFGDNQPAVDQQPANQPSGPAFGDNQPAVDQQPANQPSGPAFGDILSNSSPG